VGVPDWITVLVLGVIEGLTEFLPVSSTGHLVIAENWLHRPQSELFNIVIQCGAVCAVLLVFAKRVRELLLDWRKPANFSFIAKLLTAFVITGIGGLILKKAGLKLEERATAVAWATLIGGVCILAVERCVRGKSLRNDVTWTIAIAAGFAQLLAAAFPGPSRSGVTILIALAFGLSRPVATEFSFLLGIPTLLAAGGYEIYHALKHGETADWGMVALGSIAAAITAFIAVKWLLRFVQSHTFNVFGWYRIGLGAIILALFK